MPSFHGVMLLLRIQGLDLNSATDSKRATERPFMASFSLGELMNGEHPATQVQHGPVPDLG